MNLFNLKIGTDKYRPDVSLLGDLHSCWQVLWNYKNSAQSIDSPFYYTLMDVDSGFYYSIEYGCNLCSQQDTREPIECTKNLDYIRDRVYFIDSYHEITELKTN